MEPKLKVVWICHFSNSHIREKLSLSKKIKYGDFAPWINNLIVEFEKLDDIDLHIISPHRGLLRLTTEFKINGINYHFFKPDMPFIHKMIPPKYYFNHKIRYLFSRHLIKRFLIKRLIKKINPDVVNLIGSENPYYSIAALDIKTIPVLLSCQTVYSNPLRRKHSNTLDLYRWKVEKMIHRRIKYYGCAGRMHRDLILKNNSDAIIFKMFFPIDHSISSKILKEAKKYDFVFFAGAVTKKKGIEDAIKALSSVKKHNKAVSLNIVGQCNKLYKLDLINIIKGLGLQNNITFNDYFPSQLDMHQHITKSHFALLPVKLDVIPGTILESILLEIPVITYKTSGTPYLNKNGESVLISDIGDIEGLAENMKILLDSHDVAKKISSHAKDFVESEFDNAKSIKRLIENYKAVFNHYNYNTKIPKELLFNIKEFPLYE